MVGHTLDLKRRNVRKKLVWSGRKKQPRKMKEGQTLYSIIYLEVLRQVIPERLVRNNGTQYW